MVMALSKPMDDMVLPGKERSWQYHKKKWFVLDPETQLREPGKSLSILKNHVSDSLFRSFKIRVLHEIWYGCVSLA